MDVKGEVLLQLLNKSKLRNETKTFLEPKFSLFNYRCSFNHSKHWFKCWIYVYATIFNICTIVLCSRLDISKTL